eukprot:tig00000113_g5652.t1
MDLGAYLNWLSSTEGEAAGKTSPTASPPSSPRARSVSPSSSGPGHDRVLSTVRHKPIELPPPGYQQKHAAAKAARHAAHAKGHAHKTSDTVLAAMMKRYEAREKMTKALHAAQAAVESKGKAGLDAAVQKVDEAVCGRAAKAAGKSGAKAKPVVVKVATACDGLHLAQDTKSVAAVGVALEGIRSLLGIPARQVHSAEKDAHRAMHAQKTAEARATAEANIQLDVAAMRAAGGKGAAAEQAMHALRAHLVEKAALSGPAAFARGKAAPPAEQKAARAALKAAVAGHDLPGVERALDAMRVSLGLEPEHPTGSSSSPSSSAPAKGAAAHVPASFSSSTPSPASTAPPPAKPAGAAVSAAPKAVSVVVQAPASAPAPAAPAKAAVPATAPAAAPSPSSSGTVVFLVRHEGPASGPAAPPAPAPAGKVSVSKVDPSPSTTYRFAIDNTAEAADELEAGGGGAQEDGGDALAQPPDDGGGYGALASGPASLAWHWEDAEAPSCSW